MRRTVLMVVLAMVVAACGEEPGAEPGADDGTTTTTTSDDTGGVQVADSDLGQILVDADGLTLYVFLADSAGESTCYDQCADLWPPASADLAIGSDLDASMFGSVARDDGGDQLTINGMPLYTYTPDAAPGDTLGQGFNDVWFAVDGDGQTIETTAAGPSTTVALDYDY